MRRPAPPTQSNRPAAGGKRHLQRRHCRRHVHRRHRDANVYRFRQGCLRRQPGRRLQLPARRLQSDRGGNLHRRADLHRRGRGRVQRRRPAKHASADRRRAATTWSPIPATAARSRAATLSPRSCNGAGAQTCANIHEIPPDPATCTSGWVPAGCNINPDPEGTCVYTTTCPPSTFAGNCSIQTGKVCAKDADCPFINGTCSVAGNTCTSNADCSLKRCQGASSGSCNVNTDCPVTGGTCAKIRPFLHDQRRRQHLPGGRQLQQSPERRLHVEPRLLPGHFGALRDDHRYELPDRRTEQCVLPCRSAERHLQQPAERGLHDGGDLPGDRQPLQQSAGDGLRQRRRLPGDRNLHQRRRCVQRQRQLYGHRSEHLHEQQEAQGRHARSTPIVISAERARTRTASATPALSPAQCTTVGTCTNAGATFGNACATNSNNSVPVPGPRYMSRRQRQRNV